MDKLKEALEIAKEYDIKITEMGYSNLVNMLVDKPSDPMTGMFGNYMDKICTAVGSGVNAGEEYEEEIKE